MPGISSSLSKARWCSPERRRAGSSHVTAHACVPVSCASRECSQNLADGEDGHGELWLPRWTSSPTFREVRKTLLRRTRRRQPWRATTGLDSPERCESRRRFGSFGIHSLFVSAQQWQELTCDATWALRDARRSAPDFSTMSTLWFDRFRQKSQGQECSCPGRSCAPPPGTGDFRGGGERCSWTRSPVLSSADAEQALAGVIVVHDEGFLGSDSIVPPAWAGPAVLMVPFEQRLAAAFAAPAGNRTVACSLSTSRRGFGRGRRSGFVFADARSSTTYTLLLLREDVEAVQQDRGPHKTHCAVRMLFDRHCSVHR